MYTLPGPTLSEDLIRLLKGLPDIDLDEVLRAFSSPLSECIRINTIKVNEEEMVRELEERGWELKKVAWARHGYFVKGVEPGKTIEHKLGYVYSQGPVSMIPVEVLDPEPGDTVLDLCAAPGSKTTQIGQLMKGKGVIVANDVSLGRIKPLVTNIQITGLINVVVTAADGRHFPRWVSNTFDKVLVDVPCSSLGVISKDWKVAKYKKFISLRLSKLQRGLLLAGFDCLKPGGCLVYSTCTLAPEENEEIVNFLIDKRDSAKVEKFDIKGIKAKDGIEEWYGKQLRNDIRLCKRLYPKPGFEGFFVAKIRKGD